jgi:uncharacterized protein YukE
MQFTVTAQDLNNFANYCDSQVQEIQQHVMLLQNQVEELCSAPYQGPSSVQLLSDVTTLGNESARMQLVMSDITANLRHNALVYVDGETQNVTNLQAAIAAIAAGNAAAHG